MLRFARNDDPSRQFSVIAALVILLSFAVRLPYFTSRSLWFDEAFSWRLVQLFPSREFFARAAADVHPVLYYVVLWLWMLPARLLTRGVSGEAGLPDPEITLFWMRLLSVLLGAATVAAMIYAAYVLFRSRWAAMAAGVLTAVNAFQVQYAWEARMYTLGTALLPLALAGLVRAVETSRRRDIASAALCFALPLGVLLHVHYYALFSWVGIGLAKLLHFLRRMWSAAIRAESRTELGSGAGRRGVATALRSPGFIAAEAGFWFSGLLFLPWLPVFLQQAARVEAAFWIPKPTPWSIPNAVARLFWGGTQEFSHAAALGAVSAAAALILAALVRGRTFGDVIAASAFLTPLMLAALVSLRTSVFLDRFFLFASLGLILVMARVLSLAPRRVRMSALIFVAVLSGLSLLRFWHTLDFPAHPGVRAAAAYIEARAAPYEPIVVSSPFVYFPLSFHIGCAPQGGSCAGGRTVRLYSETGELVHFAGGPILMPDDLISPEVFHAVIQLPVRVWAVDTTGFGGSRLSVPENFRLAREESFSELFAYQGYVTVREYIQR